MKTVFAIITLISALAASPVIAADKAKGVPSIEERLNQAELSAALKQYEKVMVLQQELGLQIALLDGDSPEIERQRVALSRRMDVLTKHADVLRQTAHERDAVIQKRREVAAKK